MLLVEYGRLRVIAESVLIDQWIIDPSHALKNLCLLIALWLNESKQGMINIEVPRVVKED